jgi:F0F1-type ATP synthase epsilon subunit
MMVGFSLGVTTSSMEIVTPERLAYSDTVDSVQLPGSEGELGVLPHHAPLVSMLGIPAAAEIDAMLDRSNLATNEARR